MRPCATACASWRIWAWRGSEKRDRFRFQPDWSDRLGRDRPRAGHPPQAGARAGARRGQAQALFAYDGELCRRGDRDRADAAMDPARPMRSSAARRTVRFSSMSAGARSQASSPAVSSQSSRIGTRGAAIASRCRRCRRCRSNVQIAARAETELDRELARAIAGEAGRLPSTPAVKDALAQRIAWHERERSGGRDLTGRFEFAPEALERLREGELAQETRAFAKQLGKRALAINDGLERDWTVRGFKTLHQGRVALLERNDGVALAPLAAGQQLAIGKSYSISISRAERSRPRRHWVLSAKSYFVPLAKEGNRADVTRRHAVQRRLLLIGYVAPRRDERAYGAWCDASWQSLNMRCRCRSTQRIKTLFAPQSWKN